VPDPEDMASDPLCSGDIVAEFSSMDRSDGDLDDLLFANCSEDRTRALLLGGRGISKSASSNSVRLRLDLKNELIRRVGGGVATWYEAGRDGLGL